MDEPLSWESGDVPPGIAAVITAELAAINDCRYARWYDVLVMLCLELQVPGPVCEALFHAIRPRDCLHIFTVLVRTDSYTYCLTIDVPSLDYWIEMRTHWTVVHGAHSDIVTVKTPLHSDIYRLIHHQPCALFFDNCQVFLVPYDSEHGMPFDMTYKEHHQLLRFIYATQHSQAAVLNWIRDAQAQRYSIERPVYSTEPSPKVGANVGDPEAAAKLKEALAADLDCYCDSEEDEDWC
jgi:hypothetical protein